jgi:hypothetical protein
MKKIGLLLLSGMLLLSAAGAFTSCKKKDKERTAPTFGDELQFYFYCSTDDIKLTKMTIKDPLLNEYTYNAGGSTFLKNELYYIDEWYPKQLGNWTFTFVGNFADDNSGFTSSTTMMVSGK